MSLSQSKSFRTLARVRRVALVRGRERGAAIFVVVLALALLTGIGVWSMRTTSLVDQASGFARAATQGQYLAEMGLLTTASLLNVQSFATEADMIAAGLKPDTPRDDCQGSAAGTYCKAFEDTDVNIITTDVTPGTQGTGAPVFSVFDPLTGGSFGPVQAISPLQGRFRVEMTDGQNAVVAGSATGATNYKHVVLTSTGYLRPAANPAAITTGENLSAVQLSMRAHLVIGPLSTK
jgi:hypothetical protein